MLQSIWEDVKKEFNHGNMVTRLIIVNVAFYLLINIVWVILQISGSGAYEAIKEIFMLSSDWWEVLIRPWTLLSSMFFHDEFWHILFNMLFLYWFGKIVGDFIGDQRILPLYLLGGLVGGLAYFLSVNLMDNDTHYALGASGAVMAVVVAAGAISPDYIIRLILLGDIKLKYIVAVLLFVDIIGIGNNYNTGGHFAHLGGALFGWLFVWQLRQGNDLAIPVNNMINTITDFFRTGRQSRNGSRGGYRKKSKNVSERRRSGSGASGPNDLSYQERLDAILDKIKQSGYESLSEEEKEFLFNASKK